jgi:4'-phosphopantetheinyl transferase
MARTRLGPTRLGPPRRRDTFVYSRDTDTITTQRRSAREADWQRFARVVGLREFGRLRDAGIPYRLPLPGEGVRDGMLQRVDALSRDRYRVPQAGWRLDALFRAFQRLTPVAGTFVRSRRRAPRPVGHGELVRTALVHTTPNRPGAASSRRETIVVSMMRVDGALDAHLPRLAAALSHEERERAQRFVHVRDRITYIAAHALKRVLLAFALGGEARADALTFTIGPNGKPALEHPRAPAFNVTHCNGLVAAALAPTGAIGIDAEPIPDSCPSGVIEHACTAAERAWLGALPVRDRPEGLIRLWTLKEAFVKMTGAGLSQPFSAFSFRFDPLRIIFDKAPGNPADWGFAQVDAGPSHAVSLAWSAGQTTPVTATFVEPSELARGDAASLLVPTGLRQR